MTLSQALNQKIRELLRRERWSQREFATQLGVSPGTVSHLINGKRRASGLDEYEQLARVFDMPLSVLIADLERRVAANAIGPSPADHQVTDDLDTKLNAVLAANRAQAEATERMLRALLKNARR